MDYKKEFREKSHNMSYEEKSMIRERKMMFFLLAICVLGVGFTPYVRVFLGLLLGSAISFYNLWLLQTKVKAVAEAVKKDRKAKGLGTISRFAAVAFGVIIVFRFNEHFEMISFIIGLMTSYLVIILNFIVARRANNV